MECPKCKEEFEPIVKWGRATKFCSSKCAHSRERSEEFKLKNSQWAKENPRGVAQLRLGGKIKTRNLDKWEEVICPTCNKSFEKLKSSVKKFCSKECVVRGGRRERSGIGKSGWYDGVFLNSTYELAYWIYNRDHNIPIERMNEFYYYVDPTTNKTRKYFPDFRVDGKIIEIKGYRTPIDSIKIATCDATLLMKEDLKDIFNYVEKKMSMKIKDLYVLFV